MSDRVKELASALSGNPWVDPAIQRTLRYLLKRWDDEDKKAAEAHTKSKGMTHEEEFNLFF